MSAFVMFYNLKLIIQEGSEQMKHKTSLSMKT